MRSVLAVLALVLFAWFAQAQSGFYQWTQHPRPDGKLEMILWVNGVQVGNYRAWEDLYVPYQNGRFGRPCKPPVSIPDSWRPIAKRQNQGVNWTPQTEENTLHFGGGKQADVKKTIKRTGEVDVPNFNGMWSVTVVSPDADQRKRIVDDFQSHPDLARWKSERLKEYTPDNWALAPFKLGEDQEFAKAQCAVLVSPPCDANFKAPVHVVYGYTGAAEMATRLRDIEAKYDPNTHADQSHADYPAWQAALVSALIVGAAALVLIVGVAVWCRSR